jgi:predicted metal-dependent HD superfamily phosphohydrolase
MSLSKLEEPQKQHTQPQDQERRNAPRAWPRANVRSDEDSELATGLGIPRGVPPVNSWYKDNSREAPFVRRVEQYAMHTIGSLSTDYTYHCLEHTSEVVRYARAIASAVELNEHDFQLLLASAWLHDVGFRSTYSGHESVSYHTASELLSSELSIEDLAIIREAIMATELPQRATHLVAQILCDADLFYLGTNTFFPWSTRLRDEQYNVLGRDHTDLEWVDININFVRAHTYFTDFAKEYCKEGRAYNLLQLESLRADLK